VKLGRDPGRLAEAPEQPVRGAVKGAAVHPTPRRATQPLRAGEHLLRRAPREGEQEDALGLCPPGDELGDAVHERARLPRARAGDDEQRPVAVEHGRTLGGVEAGQRIGRGRRRSSGRQLARCGDVDAGGVGHDPNVSRSGWGLAPAAAARAGSRPGASAVPVTSWVAGPGRAGPAPLFLNREVHMTTPTTTRAAYTPPSAPTDAADVRRAAFLAYLEALGARADFARHFTDDVAFEIVGGPSARGRTEVERTIRAIHTEMFDAELHVRHVLVDGDHAAAELVFAGRHTGEFAGVPATGRRVEVPYAAAYDIAPDGRLSAVRVYMPMHVLLAQLGAGGA
jgi:steroid delta-isomerase-like uncharacterized protein